MFNICGVDLKKILFMDDLGSQNKLIDIFCHCRYFPGTSSAEKLTKAEVVELISS